MTIFLDTNIVIALLDPRDKFHDWSVAELIKRRVNGPAIVSDIVYCELAIAMKSKDDLDSAIKTLGLERVTCSDEALFRAGVAFRVYRRENAGPKLGVLPDFIVGAVAEHHGKPLMTANPKDFVRYFPDVSLVQPPRPSTVQAVGVSASVTVASGGGDSQIA